MADNNDNDETREPKIDWQFPELLSDEGLIELLKRRYVNLPDPSVLDRERLLELYHSFIIPLPQRQYRQNRRGREMTKTQIQMNKKRKITCADESEPCFKKPSLSETASNAPLPRFMTSASIIGSSSEKTEPPKSMINFDRKIIKLNSGKAKTTNSDPGPARITFSQSESKTVKLKPSSGLSSTQSSSLTVSTTEAKTTVKEDSSVVIKLQKDKTDEEPGNSPKKKIKRISWP